MLLLLLLILLLLLLLFLLLLRAIYNVPQKSINSLNRRLGIIPAMIIIILIIKIISLNVSMVDNSYH